MPETRRFIWGVVWKGVTLFLLANLLFAVLNPIAELGRLSIYNWAVPGRERLPFGSQPDLAYNLSLYNLEAMFASHEIAAGPKPADEYRVVIIGDSSIWGYLLKPEETLAAQLNAAGLTAGGKRVRFYNLGYPTLSLTKDLLMLQYAMRYQPDLVIWPVTLESMPVSRQLSSPIVQHNPDPVRELIRSYQLRLDPRDPAFVDPTFWDRTIIGQRRNLSEMIRLQLYGVLWGATGVDQYYPPTYDRPQSDLPADPLFHGMAPPTLRPEDLALDALDAGRRMAGSVPMLLVNEPIYLSAGINSGVRYNAFYPRWAYDQYRDLLADYAVANQVAYLDLWNLVSAAQFSNSAIHLTPAGEAAFAGQMARAIGELLSGKPVSP